MSSNVKTNALFYQKLQVLQVFLKLIVVSNGSAAQVLSLKMEVIFGANVSF